MCNLLYIATQSDVRLSEVRGVLSTQYCMCTNLEIVVLLTRNIYSIPWT
jgi:hypothetical protein